MNNTKSLSGVRQTAIFFASICCTAAALAIATPVWAADALSMQDTAGLFAEENAAAPTIQAPADIDPLPFIDEQLKSVDLKPGGFLWRDGATKTSGPVRLSVSIADQRAYLYRGETLVAISTVSTGRSGHPTPTGIFTISEKRAVHFSNKYNNAPMPHMQRLTNDGIALHAGHVPGHPASHGCVRLPSKFAAKLFDVTRRGTPVTITM